MLVYPCGIIAAIVVTSQNTALHRVILKILNLIISYFKGCEVWSDLTWNLKCPHWLFISSRTQVLVTRVSPVASKRKVSVRNLIIVILTHQRSQSSWHRSWPGTVPSVPPWAPDSSWCSWCRSGPWGPERHKVRAEGNCQYQRSLGRISCHLTRWIWIISWCAEVTIDGVAT